MKFSPFSIKTQEFGKGVRGYDKDEVRAYLEKLSDEFELIQSQNTSGSRSSHSLPRGQALRQCLLLLLDKLDVMRDVIGDVCQ